MQIDVFQTVPHIRKRCNQVLKTADVREKPDDNNSVITVAGSNKGLKANRQKMFDDKPFIDDGTALL